MNITKQEVALFFCKELFKDSLKDALNKSGASSHVVEEILSLDISDNLLDTLSRNGIKFKHDPTFDLEYVSSRLQVDDVIDYVNKMDKNKK